ncbi:MAG: YcjX family protein [Pseudomonadota bacterium]
MSAQRFPTVFTDPLTSASGFLEDLTTPTLRLGVTGLSRAGKTVFITSLVHCLLSARPKPPLRVISRLPRFRAYLQPQPDDDVARFAYEGHLAALTGPNPTWPEGTRHVSQLRLTFEWAASDTARQLVGLNRRLNIDIIDYPGEWLIDLAMLDQTFAEWSRDALLLAKQAPRSPETEALLAFVKDTPPTFAADEGKAIEGAKLFHDHLSALRNRDGLRGLIGPGRFLLPGDLAGSPLLTFYPLKFTQETDKAKAGSHHALLEKRFESYKTHVVKPFFERHFARIDRQIVLVDALHAINAGAEGLRELEHGLAGVLKAFRPGANSWLSLLLGRRIDRIAFAVSKADHLHHTSHSKLEALLKQVVSRAQQRAHGAGATTTSVALAALRSTKDVEKQERGKTYHCLSGAPVAGSILDGRTYDGLRQRVVFPGDLPDDPLAAFDPDVCGPEHFQFVDFAPPQLAQALDAQDAITAGPDWPHIGLDRLLAFMVEDYLT